MNARAQNTLEGTPNNSISQRAKAAAPAKSKLLCADVASRDPTVQSPILKPTPTLTAPPPRARTQPRLQYTFTYSDHDE